ncbi:MAG: hypothetical protein KAR42_09210 [candidate division Zixibacteria bacterium]|nr:hypothetical protein [candidate division Zixibacteria bacterium]
MRVINFSFSVLIILLLSSCGDDSSPTEPPPPGQTRSYYLGFTPLPHAVNIQALEYVYSKLETDADIISHHLDDGVPWPEALHGDSFHVNIMDDWNGRKNATPATHKTFLSITPIAITRDTIAPYRGETADMPLPSPWDTYTFDHDSVKAAYLNYCRRAIDFFNPDYCCIGIEVNLLIDTDPTLTQWDAYAELHKYVYPRLKTEYPDLPIMLSFTGMDLVKGYTGANHADQMSGFNDIINYTDYFGLSLHTMISVFMADSLPGSVFDNIFALSTKPIAVCETSFPSDTFSLQGGSLFFNGSESKQVDFFDTLFNRCDAVEAEFIINFVLRDYDELWEWLGSPDDINKLWKDTGFYDEDGNPRQVLTPWKEKLALPVN